MFRSDAVRPACRGGNVPRDGVGEQTSADDEVD
jgi:hypothetical protein